VSHARATRGSALGSIGALSSYRALVLGLRSVIFCEAVAIYGVIVAIILQTHLEQVVSTTEITAMMKFAGYAIFWSGMTAGFGNLACG
jgi:V-type H+-transporting ATPase proteolipid subunit